MNKPSERGPKSTAILRENTVVFFLSLLVMLAVYGIMLADRFSTDGYTDYFMILHGTIAQWRWSLGRPGGAALEELMHLLNINSVAVQLPFTLAFLALLAWLATDLWRMVVSCFSNPDKVRKGMLLVCVFPALVNISVGEFFFFSNCATHWVCMLLFGQLALRAFFARDGLGNKLLSFALLCLSLSVYQAGVGYFVAWGLLIAALRGGLRAEKKTVADMGWILIVGAGASAVIVGGQRVMELMGITQGSNRSPEVGTILTNLRYLLLEGQRGVLIDGMHFLGWTMGAVVLLLTVGVLWRCLKLRRGNVSVWLVIAMLVMSYGIAFAPHVLSPELWIAPRTIYSVFSYLSICGILILYTSGQTKAWSVAASLLICGFLLVNAHGVFTIGLEQLENNVADKYQTLAILDYIREYEQQTGYEIKKIAMIKDSATCWTNPEVKNAYMDINIRAGAMDWEFSAMLSYYSGQELQTVDVPEEVYRDFFAGKEWDQFDIEDQLFFQEDTLCVGLY